MMLLSSVKRLIMADVKAITTWGKNCKSTRKASAAIGTKVPMKSRTKISGAINDLCNNPFFIIIT